MKTKLMFITCGVVLAAVTFVAADIGNAPEKGILVGTVIEISTYATQGMAEADVPAMVSRCEQGFPVGILEEKTGQVWIAIFKNNAPASALETGNKHLQPLIGKKVSAQGMKYKAQGVNLIRVAVISEY